MIWLYILLCIVLLLAILAFIPIKIYASYFDDFKCRLVIGFYSIQLYPPKPEKEKKKSKDKSKKNKKKDKKKEEPEVEKKNLIKEKGLSWLIELIKKLAELATSVLKDFFKHILLKKLSLSISLAGSDAADTAIKYGKCCAAVYPAMSIITGAVNCPKYGVDIMPDFDENAKTNIEFELIARVFVFRIAGLVFKHGFKAIKLLIDLKN